MADEQQAYPSAQAAVDALRPGWRVVGQRPYYVTVPNEGAPSNEPQTISKEAGTILSVMGPDGSPDEITVGPSDKSVVWNTDPAGGPLPKATVVIKGPSKELPGASTTPRASPAAELERLDASFNVITDPKQPAVYIRDPKAPAGTQPYKIEPGNETGDPSKWSVVPADPEDPQGAKLIYDPQSKKVVATVPATAGQRATGEYANIVDPNDPTGKRVIGMRDKGSNQIFPVSRDPNLQKQIVSTPNKIYVFNDDGTVASTVNVDRTQPNQAVVVGGQVFAFNPNETDPTKQFVKGPEVAEPATVGISTQNEWYVFFDKNGKEVSRVKNPSYQGPSQTTQGTQSATAPFIQQWNQKTGQWEWVENKGRVTIGEATQNMINDLTGQTVDPNHPMTLEEAKTILDSAIGKMTADAQQATTAAGAAQNVLTTQAQGAQTGAGLLQQRATTAQNLIQQGLNVATSTGGRYGNYSGGMLSPVPGLGQALVQGATGYATELGGGQAVYDTAVRMVQAADPNNSNPDRATAVATLTQIMDRYKQATGQDYPTVAATKAAAASNQGQQFVSPAAVTPEVFQAQYDPRLNPAAPQQPAATVLPPGVAGTVMPGSAQYLGTLPTATQPRSAAQLGFTAPPLDTSALLNTDPRLRGGPIY